MCERTVYEGWSGLRVCERTVYEGWGGCGRRRAEADEMKGKGGGGMGDGGWGMGEGMWEGYRGWKERGEREGAR